MTKAPKNAKIYCLYHLMKDCPCIRPVTDPARVIERIEAAIRNKEIYAKFASGERKEQLDREIAVLSKQRVIYEQGGGKI